MDFLGFMSYQYQSLDLYIKFGNPKYTEKLYDPAKKALQTDSRPTQGIDKKVIKMPKQSQ